jgi:hypothetical protein
MLSEWEDGPPWPKQFDSLTNEELALAELCDGTKSGIEAATTQAFGGMVSAECETVAPGVIRVTVQRTNEFLTPEQFSRYTDFIGACASAPGIRAEVVSGNDRVESELKAPTVQSRSERRSIIDKGLVETAANDEDWFRDVRRKGFPATTVKEILRDVEGKSAVYFSHDTKDINIRAFLPLYDVVYAPADVLMTDDDIYGMKRSETFELIRGKRIVPVVSREIRNYDQKRLREIVEIGHFVPPRRLAAGIILQLLSANPLWRVAMADTALAKAHIDDLRKGISSQDGATENVRAFLSRWIDYQVLGCLNIGTGVVNDIGMLPLSLGPGAFLSDVVYDSREKVSQDSTLRIIGLDVSHAMALNAMCVPLFKDKLYGLYDMLVLFSRAREAKQGDKGLQLLPVIAQLDEILARLKITCPSEIPVTEWIEIATPLMGELRNSLKAVLATGKSETLQDVRARASELEASLNKLSKGNMRSVWAADTFEIVGVVSEALACEVGLHFPYAGTIVGIVIKRLFPKLWEVLGKSDTTLQVRDFLEASNSFVWPHVVRLHRAKREFHDKLAK